MKSINIIAIMPFLALSFMMQAPVYQDVNQPIEDRVVDVWKTNSKQESHVSRRNNNFQFNCQAHRQP